MVPGLQAGPRAPSTEQPRECPDTEAERATLATGWTQRWGVYFTWQTSMCLSRCANVCVRVCAGWVVCRCVLVCEPCAAWVCAGSEGSWLASGLGHFCLVPCSRGCPEQPAAAPSL